MPQRRLLRLGVAIGSALAIVLVAGPGPAAADPHDDQERVNKELATTRSALESASDRVANAAVALQQANGLLPAAQDRLAQARGVLAGAQAQADSAANDARAAADRLGVADRGYASAALDVDHTREQIGEFASLAYMGRDAAGMNALLQAQSPAQFLAGLTYLDGQALDRHAALDANLAARTVARNSQNQQALQKRTADDASARFADALARARAAADAAAQAEQQVATLIAQRQDALATAESERADTEARLAALQAESDRIQAEIQALARSGSGQVIRPGSRLPMPVVGWKSSDFGWRYDPFYQRWQLHAGVDFAAAGGTPIWAAASGQVIQAGWDGGYGNYTCIYHGTYGGQGFATCYAHQSAILVSVGQRVSQGQVIGRVGTTGASTGDHLHFEVRLDGAPVNPLPWLPACLC